MERADNLAKRKEIYEKLFPQTKHGANVQNLKQGNIIPEVPDYVTSEKRESFVDSTAKLTGQSEKMITKRLGIDCEMSRKWMMLFLK